MNEDPVPALKERLAEEILAALRDDNFWSAARALRIDPSRLSDLRKGRSARFSVDKLVRMLSYVNRRVDVSVVKVPAPRRQSIRRDIPRG